MKKLKKGFTLVELIVVIAIIGVLAAILVPVMTGYVRESQKRVDMETARQLGERIVTEIAKDDDMYYQFSRNDGSNTVYNNVYQVVGGVSEDPYTIKVVSKITGVKNGYYRSFTQGTNRQNQDFSQKLDQIMEVTKGNPAIPMKSIKHSGGIVVDEWLVCIANGDPEKVEIWAGSKERKGRNESWFTAVNGFGCNPRYRLWPNPCDEYTNFTS